jgi:sialic acid synthase SpsE
VKEMEDAVVELVGLSEHSVHYSSAVQAYGNRYQPGEQVIESHHLLSFNYLINVILNS